MDQRQDDISPVAAAEHLTWLIAMGADEVIGETPCNRFALQQEPEKAVRAETALRPLPVFKPQDAPRPAPTAVREMPDDTNWPALIAQSQSLEDLAILFHSYEGSALRKAAMNLCFVGGNLQSRIMVIGDRPRTAEDKEGLVFAGKTAVLLDNMLKAIGLAMQDDVLLANFIPWRPPGNRPVTEVEARQCLPFVGRLLEIVKPKVILSLGGIAGQWLAGGDQSIAKQRGKWLEASGYPLIATFHPDDLIRTPALKKLAWADLKMFRHRLDEAGD